MEKNEKRIARALELGSSNVPKLPPREVKRFRSRIEKNVAFKIYRETGSLDEVSKYMFADLLEASPDAPSEVLDYKFERLLNLAELAQDDEIISLVINLHFSVPSGLIA